MANQRRRLWGVKPGTRIVLATAPNRVYIATDEFENRDPKFRVVKREGTNYLAVWPSNWIVDILPEQEQQQSERKEGAS